MFGWFKKKLESIFTHKEYYVRVESPEKYAELVPKGVSLELAETKKELMKVRKELKKKDEYIKDLLGRKDKELEMQAEEQLKRINKLKKSREYKIWFNPQKPIIFISSFNSEPFLDEYGEKRPFWRGIKLVSTPVEPYIVFLLAKKPRSKDVANLETDPLVYLSRFHEVFKDTKLLVHSLLTGGIVEVNITPDGYFSGAELPFRVKREVVERKERKK